MIAFTMIVLIRINDNNVLCNTSEEMVLAAKKKKHPYI